MAATLVLDPTEGGWNIVNYDDFRNSTSAFIDRSFIPYPSEDSGITDEQAIDEIAGYLGASGWTTTSELEDEAGTAGLRGFLEDEETQLERKLINKRDVQMKESSKKTATSYDFWDKDDSDPSFITGQYGIPGDYMNSRQWNAIQIDDGRWDVSVVGSDGFPKEVGLYRTISEAGSALLQYLNENGITASFNKEGRMSASVRKSYIGSFWGDTQDNGFGGYEYYYGEDGEENNSVMLYGTPDGDSIDCQVMSPEGDTLDSYSADSWEEAKDRFDTDCEINHLYEDYIHDPQDPFDTTTASVVKANGPFMHWYSNDGEYLYGIEGDEYRSLGLNIIYGDEEDGIEPYAEIVAPNGEEVASRTFGFGATEDEIKRWFEDYCYYDIDMPDYIDMTGVETASVKTSMDEDSNGYSFWGEEPIDDGGFSVWYGEFQEPQNSLPVDVEYYDASSFSYDPDDPGYFTISLRSSTEWDAEDLSSEISDVSQDTLDEVWEELKQDLPNIASRHLIPIKEFDEMKLNGEIATASVKTSKIINSNGYEFDDSEWDAIANLMDDEVREQVANELDDPTNQEFFDAYAKAHEDKFGEEWELDKANPVW